MADELLVFEQTIEALFVRALGGRLSPDCRSRLRQAGLDVDQKLKPAYPFACWMSTLRIAAEEVFPTLPLPEATFKLGEAYVEGFRQTMLGRAVISLLRVLGPRLTLARATQSFRAGNNYTETRLSELSPTQFDLWLNEVGAYPEFTAGIIQAGLRMAGAKDLRVEPLGYDGHGCSYRITWQESSVYSGAKTNPDSKGSKRAASSKAL